MLRTIMLLLGAGMLTACQTAPAPIDYSKLTDYQKACELAEGQTSPTERLVSHSVAGTAKTDLVVILHGRSSLALKGQPDSTLFVERAERLHRDTGGTATIAAIARPGYSMKGQTSPGEAFGGSDNATALNTAWIANEIAALKAQYSASRVTLIGDSEGGLSAAAIAACYPKLVDHLLLGRCPCDLATWPSVRPGLKPFQRSPSPIALIEQFEPDLIVRVTTAPMDKQTPDLLAKNFLAAAQARELDAEGFFEGEKPGHGWSKVRDYLTEQVRVLTRR